MSENLNVDAPSFTPMAGSPGPWSLADVGASPWRPDSQQQRAAAVAALALGAAAGTRLPMTIAAQRLISQQQPPRARAFSAPADVDDDDGAQTSSSDDGGVSPRIRAQVSPRSSLGKSSNSRRYSQEMRDQGSASGSGGQSGSATGSGTAPQQNQSLYKTELCRSFVETGSCRYGSKCQFAHGKEELRQVSRHPRYKTEICKTFHTIGTCRYGTRCRFIHMKPEEYEQFQQQQAAQAALAAQQSQQLGSSSPSASSSGAGAGLVAPSSPPKSVMGPGVVASAVPPMMISPKNAASPMMVASAPNSPLMCSSIAGSPGFPSSPALMGQPPLHQALNFQLRQTMTVGSLSLPPPLPVSDFQSFQTRMDPQKTVVEQPPLSSPRSPRSPIYNSAPPPLLSHPGAPQGLTVVPPAPLAPGTPEPASPGMTRRRLAVFREITM